MMVFLSSDGCSRFGGAGIRLHGEQPGRRTGPAIRSAEGHLWSRDVRQRPGQHHQALGFDMFRVQDGKIAEHWDAD